MVTKEGHTQDFFFPHSGRTISLEPTIDVYFVYWLRMYLISQKEGNFGGGHGPSGPFLSAPLLQSTVCDLTCGCNKEGATAAPSGRSTVPGSSGQPAAPPVGPSGHVSWSPQAPSTVVKTNCLAIMGRWLEYHECISKNILVSRRKA